MAKKLSGAQKIGLAIAGAGAAYGLAVGTVNVYSGDNPNNHYYTDAVQKQEEARTAVRSSAAKYYKTVGSLTRSCSELVTSVTQDDIPSKETISTESDMFYANPSCYENDQNDITAAVVTARELRDKKTQLDNASNNVEYQKRNSFNVDVERDRNKGINETWSSGAPLIVGAGLVVAGIATFANRRSKKA